MDPIILQSWALSFIQQTMMKTFKVSQEVETLAKLIETIMQLRVDVKREEADYFRNILIMLRTPHDPRRAREVGALSNLSVKDLYGVRGKLASLRSWSEATITVKFSFVNKRDQSNEIAQIWRFHSMRQTFPDSRGSNSLIVDNQNMELLFEHILDTLFRLPLWLDYWHNVDKRRLTKQTSILDFSISYQQEASLQYFPFDSKSQKQHTIHGMTFWLSVTSISKLRSLNLSVSSPRDVQKVTNIRKLSSGSSRTRRCSVYEYYDEQLDITFVSSEGEFSPNDNSMSEITYEMPIEDDGSDEEYEIVIESPEDIRYKQFVERLTTLKQQVGDLDNTLYML